MVTRLIKKYVIVGKTLSYIRNMMLPDWRQLKTVLYNFVHVIALALEEKLKSCISKKQNALRKYIKNYEYVDMKSLLW